MRVLGVALAACCATVFWPTAAHANPIGAQAGATMTLMLSPVSMLTPGVAADADRDSDDGMFSAQAGLDQSVQFAATGAVDLFNDDRASLGHVVDVAGFATLANNQITLALRLHDIAGDHDGIGHAWAFGEDKHPAQPQGPEADPPAPHGLTADPPAPHGPVADPPAPHGPVADPPGPPADPPGGGGVQTSATPEPASLLLLATGLAGVLWFRRQLFA